MSHDVEARIRQRAYEIWEREGRPEGRDWEHWLTAETEVSSQPADAAKAKASTRKPAAAKAPKKEAPAAEALKPRVRKAKASA